MLIDTHTHLADERYDEDRETVINNFEADNLEFVIEIGSDYPSSLKAFELGQKYKNIYTALGVHPHEAKNVTKENYEHFKQLAKNEKVVAIGEIGLDYFYDLSDRETQKRVFAEQLELADSLNLPVILHIRDAYEDAFNILKDNKDKLNNGVLFHCYSGSKEMAEQFMKHFDMYFAFGGAITFKKAKKEEIIKTIPRDRLLIETDSPYLTPEPNRGKRNEPKYVGFVAEKIANILEITLDELMEINRENTLRLFSRIKR